MRAGKRFNLFISNENMNCIINMIILLVDSGVLMDWVNETVKDEIKIKRANFLEPY